MCTTPSNIVYILFCKFQPLVLRMRQLCFQTSYRFQRLVWWAKKSTTLCADYLRDSRSYYQACNARSLTHSNQFDSGLPCRLSRTLKYNRIADCKWQALATPLNVHISNWVQEMACVCRTLNIRVGNKVQEVTRLAHTEIYTLATGCRKCHAPAAHWYIRLSHVEMNTCKLHSRWSTLDSIVRGRSLSSSHL